MGYYVDLTNHDFTVKVEHYPTIIERWLDFEKEHLGYYTSIFDRSDDMLPMQDDVAKLFTTIGFDVHENSEVLTIEGFEGKSWMEADYIRAIADLAEPGWFLDWHGEDDEHWRQNAAGTQGSTIIFDDLIPLVAAGKAALATTDPMAVRLALAALIEALP